MKWHSGCAHSDYAYPPSCCAAQPPPYFNQSACFLLCCSGDGDCDLGRFVQSRGVSGGL